MAAIFNWPATIVWGSGSVASLLLVMGSPGGGGVAKETIDANLESWSDVAQAINLEPHPMVDASGRAFLPARGTAPCPVLDDGRIAFDGSDGFRAGLAINHPMYPLLHRHFGHSLRRLGTEARLTDSLAEVEYVHEWGPGLRLASADVDRRLFTCSTKGDLDACCWLLALAVAMSERTTACAKPIEMEGLLGIEVTVGV